MRNLILTTALVLPVAFAPAWAQDAATETVIVPAPEAEVSADDAAMATEADSAAMAEEVAASGKVAREQAMNELRLDWITDATVTSPAGNAIGDINDLIVDAESGQMVAAVIGVGGFLGIGEKQIAVPWDRLSVNYDAQEIMSDLSEEEADAAPEYVLREREEAPTVVPAADTMAPVEGDAPADALMTPGAEGDDRVPDAAVLPEDSAVEADVTVITTDGAETGDAPMDDAAPMDGAAPMDDAATDTAEPMDDAAAMDGDAETDMQPEAEAAETGIAPADGDATNADLEPDMEPMDDGAAEDAAEAEAPTSN